MLNKTILKYIEHHADMLRIRADILLFNIKYNRVSHTVGLLKRLFDNVAFLQHSTTDNAQYSARLQACLLSAQIGPTEFVAEDSTVFIQGNFKLDMLRDLLVACETPRTIKGEFDDD